jgi:sulfate adenylyltransferase subunit 2
MNYLISKSEYIIREVRSRFRKPAVLWSTGKDSTCMLHLIRGALGGEIPFPVIHLDTGKKFREIYDFRKRLSEEWNLKLIIGTNAKALESGMSPEKGYVNCCNALKTGALKQVLEEHRFDALIMSIRRDEHAMRNIERFFSPRDRNFEWHIVRPRNPEELGDSPFESLQPTELWDLYQTDFGNDCSHVRIHPILHWNEIDVWKYIKKEGIPVNPLYFSRDGLRFRSLGCECCTKPIKSEAGSIDEIIMELESTEIPERSGRSQDKEHAMRKLRSMGYM